MEKLTRNWWARNQAWARVLGLGPCVPVWGPGVFPSGDT